MKKQTDKNALTKEDLTDILKDYPTKNDLKRELKGKLTKKLSNYPTKDYLSERLTASQNVFRTEMKYEFSILKEEILAGMSKFTNLILTTIDPLLKELETRREDREIATFQIEEIKSNINTHEKRIRKLEHS